MVTVIINLLNRFYYLNMKFIGKYLIIFLIILNLILSAVNADPFVDRVVEVNYGEGAGFGQENFPDIVLGGPEGAGDMQGSLDVLSLGDGGYIILEFTDNIVVNKEGPDFIIFENPFFIGGDPENVFAEVAFVEVSQDGEHFIRFPNDYRPNESKPNSPENWIGFAGVNPVYANSENGIDPKNPDLAGGDAFDLSLVKLDWIKFIKIIDTGEGDNAQRDDNGDLIYDPGTPGGTSAGFDLDAICAIHSIDIITPTPINYPLTVELLLNKSHFNPGDHFQLLLNISNFKYNNSFKLYIIFQVNENYWFYPNWTPYPTFLTLHLNNYQNKTLTILDFIFPQIYETYDNLQFWAGCTDFNNSLISNIDNIKFTYE